MGRPHDWGSHAVVTASQRTASTFRRQAPRPAVPPGPRQRHWARLHFPALPGGGALWGCRHTLLQGRLAVGRPFISHGHCFRLKTMATRTSRELDGRLTAPLPERPIGSASPRAPCAGFLASVWEQLLASTHSHARASRRPTLPHRQCQSRPPSTAVSLAGISGWGQSSVWQKSQQGLRSQNHWSGLLTRWFTGHGTSSTVASLSGPHLHAP